MACSVFGTGVMCGVVEVGIVHCVFLWVTWCGVFLELNWCIALLGFEWSIGMCCVALCCVVLCCVM